jgi:hypothetical protein
MRVLTPPEFLRTIYVGDRACKAIHIESWKGEVALEVNLVSRIRSPSGNWEFYSAEDIPDGRIVFTGVEAIQFEPPGPIPNDVINEIAAKPADTAPAKERWEFEASIGAVAPDGSSAEVIVRIIGTDVHLEGSGTRQSEDPRVRCPPNRGLRATEVTTADLLPESESA